MGWGGAGAALAGCDLPTTQTLEEGKETVVSYLVPEEYVIPGVGVWYASTCQQCSAGCGIHGRVREGRVLKLEGNPESPISKGKLCQMGQAGLQGHYNPDRVTKPMARKNGKLVEIEWDEAEAQLKGAKGGSGFAWFTGNVSGHQHALVNAHLKSMGSSRHYTYEVVNQAVSESVNKKVLGQEAPRFRIDKADLVLSFGNDFLGAGASPVNAATQYADMRQAPRGVLVQVEAKMTLTGASADRWVAAHPGSEGHFALGLAYYLINRKGFDASVLPAAVRKEIDNYTLAETTVHTGVDGDRIVELANMLAESQSSLVLSGASAELHEHGYAATASIMALNVLLGNVGKTIEGAVTVPFADLQPTRGNTKSLLSFSKDAAAGKINTVFFYGANPVFNAPDALHFDKALAQVPFKVAFAQFHDETVAQADLVLPMHSYIEDWGTHISAYQGDEAVMGIQQPLMEPIYTTTRGFGDTVLAVLKSKGVSGFSQFDDYFSYLSAAISTLPSAAHKEKESGAALWSHALQHGQIKLKGAPKRLTANLSGIDIQLPGRDERGDFPFHMLPTARLGLWDGRHANIPWLQEAPDQISKVVWGSWVELHPKAAKHIGVKNGDFVRLQSEQGEIKAQVYVFKGMHPESIGVPLGQGHTEYGRYAKERGVNPLKIVNVKAVKETGELASFATTVNVTVSGHHEVLVKMGGSESQVGRKIVATITAEKLRRTEGGKHVA